MDEKRQDTDYEKVKRDREHGKIFLTRSGFLRMSFPTKLNKFLKPFNGKDLDLTVRREGADLLLALTDKESSKNIIIKMEGFSETEKQIIEYASTGDSTVLN